MNIKNFKMNNNYPFGETDEETADRYVRNEIKAYEILNDEDDFNDEQKMDISELEGQ
jgi:hypothetical protein